jgi:quercetin dioxygenase-like cupin family protein
MSYFTTLEETKSKEIFPGFTGKFEHTTNMTLAFWDVVAGSSVPEHSHIHEQVVTVREGKLELIVNGKCRIMDAGCIAVIPSNVKHSAHAITNCKLLDVFYPVREDYKI